MAKQDFFTFNQHRRIKHIYALASSANYPTLTGIDIAVLTALSYFADVNGENIFPSINTLHAHTRMGRSTILRSLARLRSAGLLLVVQQIKNKSTEYRLLPALCTGDPALFNGKQVVSERDGVVSERDGVVSERDSTGVRAGLQTAQSGVRAGHELIRKLKKEPIEEPIERTDAEADERAEERPRPEDRANQREDNPLKSTYTSHYGDAKELGNHLHTTVTDDGDVVPVTPAPLFDTQTVQPPISDAEIRAFYESLPFD